MAEFSSNNHVSETTSAFPFSPIMGSTPQELRVPDRGSTSQPVSPEKFVKDMNDIHDQLQVKMRYAQNKHEQNANATRTPAPPHPCTPAPNFVVGDLVWLSTTNIKTARCSKKLNHKRLGTFKITEVTSPQASRLELHQSLKIQLVFHVSLLEQSSSAPVPDQVVPPPSPVEIEGHEE